MTITRDVQETIVSALLKSSYLFSICKTEISDGYFSDPACKVIYKALSAYYDKYQAIPRLNELLIQVDDVYYPTVGVDLSEVKDTCQKLWNFPEPEEAFIKDKITDFVRKVRSASALKEFIEAVKLNPNLESDEIVTKLVKALEVSLSTTKVFMMNDPDQVKEARVSAVGLDQSKVIRSFIDSINKNLTFGGYQPSTVNLVPVSPPGTGKSMFLINEGKFAAQQGFNVLHIFIGDMVEYDGFIRYLSCISGTPIGSLVLLDPDKQMDVVKMCNQQYNNIFDKLFIVAYPSLSLSVDTLMEDVARFEKQLEKDFDMIIVDYPDNLIQDGVSLYTDGGTLYSSLEKMARLTRSVVLVASQPQKAYWNHEIIPLEAASDSSKKQMAVDVMLTMNTASRGAPFGSMLLAKARKGSVGKVFRFKTEFDKCRLEEIDEATYNAMRSQYGIK